MTSGQHCNLQSQLCGLGQVTGKQGAMSSKTLAWGQAHLQCSVAAEHNDSKTQAICDNVDGP